MNIPNIFFRPQSYHMSYKNCTFIILLTEKQLPQDHNLYVGATVPPCSLTLPVSLLKLVLYVPWASIPIEKAALF